ncbi:reverse transcriptase domain-containing protein [Gilvimarinus algae]|uniref:Reverse transcriptase domain-containing protein n=1 Tax=Gilvimarinus algae TaxID=3058037 RepID=A0ABT8TFP6_9GAMM|nr:reverse transcriptase domain-containing protein [Gilvimarinus sp. SDUM040014]MDO3382465.1 reverse transcriptase domain-containing protein [Gilvimarinus sp. SDUM040014]
MTSAWKDFETCFSIKNLKLIFSKNIKGSRTAGADNMSPEALESQLDTQTSIVNKKVLSGSYSFTRYKKKLVSKGSGKAPREISVPTARDRLALRALTNFLHKRFNNSTTITLPQSTIRSLKYNLGSGYYGTVIKLDVEEFYPSIKHDELNSRLRKRIKDLPILKLVSEAIRTTFEKGEKSDRGVPQGLSISNILSSIYLINIDKKFLSKSNIFYCRYVDDIIILCRPEDTNEILNEVITSFKRIGLKIHDPKRNPEKSRVNRIDETFHYLGYRISYPTISVRDSSVERIKESLAAMFTSFKHSKGQSLEFLEWRVNLRITGCIYENKCKGWIFFFSEMNDEELLHKLDNYVKKLCKRFNTSITRKRFSRSHKEILHNRYKSKYIQNFDHYSEAQKRAILIMRYGHKMKSLSSEKIEAAFHDFISRQVSDLLEDIKSFGSG